MHLDLNTTIAVLEESATFRAFAAQTLLNLQQDKFAPRFASTKADCKGMNDDRGKIPAIKLLREIAQNDQPFIDYLCVQTGAENSPTVGYGKLGLAAAKHIIEKWFY